MDGKTGAVIEKIAPEIDHGRFPIKRIIGENILVQADIFTHGHDEIAAILLYRHESSKKWRETPMKLLNNDRLEGVFNPQRLGIYYYTIRAWVDYFKTWRNGLHKKIEAGQQVKIDLLIGVDLIKKALKNHGGNSNNHLNIW
ncbi:MAG: maltotransferase domain-containing protein, partial [bacterium]